MLAQLIPVKDADNKAKAEVALGEGRATFGRAPGNKYVLDDPEVSKFHAEIVGTEGVYVLMDLGSSNGTTVNGNAIEKHNLKVGDLVEFGTSRFTFALREEKRRASVTLVADAVTDSAHVLVSASIDPLVPSDEIKEVAVLRGQYDRVRTAFEAVQELIETTDLQKLCKGILDVVFKLVQAESGSVFLFNKEKKLVPWATKFLETENQTDTVLSRTIAERVFKDKAAVIVADALTDDRWSGAKSVVVSGIRSLMYVPLLNNDRIYGLLHVGNASQIGAFSKVDLELMTGIGTGAGVAISNAYLAKEMADAARTRESLGRFLSPVLVEQVMDNNLDLTRGGEEKDVTVMFADIRGFTSLTERLAPGAVVALLNEYFEQMVEVVFHHQGILDKFIGDCIMAVWGTPVQHDDDAIKALAAACDMQAALRTLNVKRKEKKLRAVEVGIGLASGPCVVGNIGANRRLEYTVIGDAVNLASRLSGEAQAGQVVCDRLTFERSGEPDDTKLKEEIKVKGKEQPVPIYRIVPGEWNRTQQVSLGTIKI